MNDLFELGYFRRRIITCRGCGVSLARERRRWDRFNLYRILFLTFLVLTLVAFVLPIILLRLDHMFIFGPMDHPAFITFWPIACIWEFTGMLMFSSSFRLRIVVYGRNRYCLKCHYNVRGVVGPMCPECGAMLIPNRTNTRE